MTEQEFIENIDCKFPYEDVEAATNLINVGTKISSNCCFAIIEEVTLPPKSSKIPLVRREQILTELSSKFQHPLKDEVLLLARARIQGQEIVSERLNSFLEQFKQFPGQYAAINIVVACSNQGDELVEQKADKIREGWRKG